MPAKIRRLKPADPKIRSAERYERVYTGHTSLQTVYRVRVPASMKLNLIPASPRPPSEPEDPATHIANYQLYDPLALRSLWTSDDSSHFQAVLVTSALVYVLIAVIAGKGRWLDARQILCGCGNLDGTEISEAISTAIHLQHKKMKPLFYAPDIEICGVINHFTKEMNTENSRNALVESARLARGCIKPLHECEACTHDALIIPGGFGAARILSNFAEKGTDCTVLPDLEKLIEDFHCDKKPIGTMCIANALVAKVLKGVKITLGKESPKNDWPHADAIKKVKDMGAKIEMKDVKGVTFDKNFGVLSTPAWLYEPATFSDIYDGIGKLIIMLKRCINK
ncbi:PREDICTED: ES1 protein homolog, mitochondrial-like [Atta cephalotes]|uniref:DJ-1/PfpI domain-containing protein n=1 Tax=Atta cephalotes TaxID=12957 RepID=A0A158NCF7_ATTCE|nr:PREDICTED: ES1 protein homolog, mitochondrial-like [Atta cephalotes]